MFELFFIGTHVYTDKTVSVVVGTRTMPGASGSVFHFSEQLVPVREWGTEFVLTGLFTDYGSIAHITSSARRTYVTLTGFRTNLIRIPFRGQTIRRRLEKGVTCHVTSNKPIQVMMYYGLTSSSTDVLASFVSMTLVPAFQHFLKSYTTQCSDNNMATFFQTTTYFGAVMSHWSISNITDVAYTPYEVRQEIVYLGLVNIFTLETLTTMEDEFRSFGGLMKCDTAMFPIGPLILVVSSNSYMHLYYYERLTRCSDA